MVRGLQIAFFGSSLLSAYWNGAATYYRGIIRALHARGHHITFYEPDAYNRQEHRDIEPPRWADVVVYPSDNDQGVIRALEQASNADVIVKASGVGVFDELLETLVPTYRRNGAVAIYWDVDAPATLARMQGNPADPLRDRIRDFDLVFTYGGGQPVIEAFRSFGARECVPIYNALDPHTHHPAAAQARFDADLAFLGNRLPDREARVDEFFFRAAETLSTRRFLLGGSGWDDHPMSGNVNYIGHVYTRDHNALNCSSLAVLNISRESMADNGWSPATRVFEAAGAGACLITDAWRGIDDFLEPGKEVLVAQDGLDVAAQLDTLGPQTARRIGDRARRRVLAHHTYDRRADEVEALLTGVDRRSSVAG